MLRQNAESDAQRIMVCFCSGVFPLLWAPVCRTVGALADCTSTVGLRSLPWRLCALFAVHPGHIHCLCICRLMCTERTVKVRG